ncbi:hypothetical protein [Azotobacter armeniacus]
MHRFGILTLTFSLLALSNVLADEIIGETEDQTAGQSAGGMTGMMVGAIGGPIGALVGAGVGALVGSTGQEASGSSDRAYQVRTDSGKVQTVRSPNRRFTIGDQVEIRGNRPYPTSAGKSAALADADGRARALR